MSASVLTELKYYYPLIRPRDSQHTEQRDEKKDQRGLLFTPLLPSYLNADKMETSVVFIES